MSGKREWQIGDWVELRSVRYLVFNVIEDGTAWAIPKIGGFNEIMFCREDDEVKLIDGCDSWTWQPPKLIGPPPGYRLLRDDERIKEGDKVLQRGIWEMLQRGIWEKSIAHSYTVKSQLSKLSLAYARKIEPTYRPFQSASEFKPHRDRWITWKVDGEPHPHLQRIGAFNDSVVWPACASTGTGFANAFEKWTFEDGSPFGMRIV
tara:strand:+ start:93 stop:707 length:615 start_codon:yes stop_codon:yes gene_type:complete